MSGGSTLKRVQRAVSETGARIGMHGKKARPEGYGLPEGAFAEFIRNKKTGMRVPNGHGKSGCTDAVSRATRSSPGHQIPGIGIGLLQGASKGQTPVIPDGEACPMQKRERVRHLGSAVPSNTGQAGKPESGHPPPGARLRCPEGPGYKGPVPRTMAGAGSRMGDPRGGSRPDPEGQPQNNGSGGKPAGRPLEAEQAAGLKTLQMARRRARVKVRDRPADRQPAKREMTFLQANPHTTTILGLPRSRRCWPCQRRPLLVGRLFLSGMTLDRQKNSIANTTRHAMAGRDCQERPDGQRSAEIASHRVLPEPTWVGRRQ